VARFLFVGEFVFVWYFFVIIIVAIIVIDSVHILCKKMVALWSGEEVAVLQTK